MNRYHLILKPAILAFAALSLVSCTEEAAKNPPSAGTTESGRQDSPIRTTDVGKKAAAEEKCKAAAELLRVGKLEGARALFREALTLDPDNSSAKIGTNLRPVSAEAVARAADLAKQGQTALQAGRLLEAFHDLQQAYDLNPNDFDAADKLAMAAWNIRRFDVAMRVCDEIIAVFPFEGATYVKGAQAAYSAADFDRCLRYLHQADSLIHATEALAKNAELWFMRGIAAKKQSLIPEAVDCLQRAIRLNPKRPDYVNNLGGIFLDDGQYDLAIRTFKDLMEMSPTEAYAPYHIAIALDKQGNKAEAIEWYKKSLQRDNTNWQCCVKIARCYESMGGTDNLNKAISYCDLALSKNELSHEALFTLGSVHRKAGNATEADKNHERYVSITALAKEQEELLRDVGRRLRENPKDIAAHVEAIEIQVRFRHWDDAIDEVKRLLIQDPHHVEGLIHASRLYFTRKDYIASLWEAVKATEIAPNDSRGFTFAAYSCLQLNRIEEATKWAEKSVAINPEDFGAIEALIGALQKTGGQAARIAELTPKYLQLKRLEEERIKDFQRKADEQSRRLLETEKR